MTRFVVKPIHTDSGTTLHQVVDTRNRAIVETFARARLAERACAQLNAAHAARQAARDGAARQEVGS